MKTREPWTNCQGPYKFKKRRPVAGGGAGGGGAQALPEIFRLELNSAAKVEFFY